MIWMYMYTFSKLLHFLFKRRLKEIFRTLYVKVFDASSMSIRGCLEYLSWKSSLIQKLKRNLCFRFSHVSPAKSRTPARSSRTPLATRASVNTERTSVVPPTKLDFGKEAPSDVKPLSNCHLMTSSRLTVEEVEEIWKNMTLDRWELVHLVHTSYICSHFAKFQPNSKANFKYFLNE